MSTSIPTRLHSIHAHRQPAPQWWHWLAVSKDGRAKCNSKHLRARVPVPEPNIRSLLIRDIEPVQEQPELVLGWYPAPFRFSVRRQFVKRPNHRPALCDLHRHRAVESTDLTKLIIPSSSGGWTIGLHGP